MSDLVRMSDIIRIYNNYDCDKAREEVMKLPPIDMVGELEKIKKELEEKTEFTGGGWYLVVGWEIIEEVIDKKISQLKGEQK